MRLPVDRALIWEYLPLLCLGIWPSTGDLAYWAVLLAGIAAAASPLGRLIFRSTGRWVESIAAKPIPAISVLAGFSLAISISLSMALGIPAPRLHDEFSQLLAADTFAHGRVTNPRHPMARHFETIHVLQSPTYSSKFPPAQGLVMALGMVTLGLPIAGQWLATAGACIAIWWMLREVLPPKWAFFGGLLAAIHPQVLTWSQGYLGSSIALAGGALVLGSFLRIIHRPGVACGILLALGLSILANSRPYEGLQVSVPMAIAFLVWLARTDSSTRRLAIRRVVVPCAVVMSLTFGAMAYYNWRITGSALLSPYVLHERLYNRTPHFFFQAIQPPMTYEFKENEQLHGQWEPAQWYAQRTFIGWTRAAGARAGAFITTWLTPPLLALPLLAFPWAQRRMPLLRLILILILLFMAGLLPLTWILRPHYFTPAGGLFFLLLVTCMYHLHTASASTISRVIVRIALAGCIIAAGHQTAVLYGNEVNGWQGRRANVIQALQDEPGDHLVIVRYLPEHDVHQEWVYNEADIDAARIVWAREMTPQQDRELLEYFKTRKVWLLEVGQTIRITPYTH